MTAKRHRQPLIEAIIVTGLLVDLLFQPSLNLNRGVLQVTREKGAVTTISVIRLDNETKSLIKKELGARVSKRLALFLQGKGTT